MLGSFMLFLAIGFIRLASTYSPSFMSAQFHIFRSHLKSRRLPPCSVFLPKS